MEKREYGNTGEMLSIIGFGGIVVKDVSSSSASADVSWSIDQGINYFDVAPGYGNAQDMLGPALKPYRKDVFLACKTGKRNGRSARVELEKSLKLMITEYFDLYQLHAIKSLEDVDQACAIGGVLDMLVKARAEGLIRYIGFSAHSAEAAIDLMDRFQFDSVLFPVNFVTCFESGFGPQIMKKAIKTNTARLALKALALHKLNRERERVREKCWYVPIEDEDLSDLALRFTLSQPITAAIPPGDPELFRMAVKLGQRFKPLTVEENNVLKEVALGKEPIFELVNI